MSQGAIATRQSIVLAGSRSGVTVIPSPTPLTRLHYFDGKFLRAGDLELEQRYLRGLVALSNQAGGAGVVHGFDCTLAGDGLTVGAGLAIDPEGQVLLLPEARTMSLAELIEASRRRFTGLAEPLARRAVLAGAAFADCAEAAADDSGAVAEGATLYLIVVGHAEALCGEEDVYGKLCAEACVTSTERPYTVEGIFVRAVPLALATPLATSRRVPLTGRHLRSRVASAYFEDERRRVASLISRAGLAAEAWCLGARAAGDGGVPIAVVARAGSATLFLDAWTARRERIETPPRRYWAWTMAMRPWDVFLAQVLQFQCQLRDLVGGGAGPVDDDPCADAHRALRNASEGLDRVLRQSTEALAGRLAAGAAAPGAEAVAVAPHLREFDAIRERLASAVGAFTAVPRERILIAGGIVETPSAGYLPVVPAAPLSVDEQVRRLLGDGLDLRFCIVRPDFVPHALEEAQHMERISLLQGLDDPANKPRVDVLVPDGILDPAATVTPGRGYETRVRLETTVLKTFHDLFETRPAVGPAIAPATAATSSAFTAEVAERRVVAAEGRLVAQPGREAIALYGAARGEDLPGGGLAFHFAGGSERRPRLATPVRPDLAVTAATETAVPLGRRAAVAFDDRLTGLTAAEALRALNPLATTARPALGVLAPVPQSALWVTLEANRDPFDLPVHGSARLSAELTLLHPGAQPRAVRSLRFTGDLTVEDRRTLPDGSRRLTCRLAGDAIATDRRVDANTSAAVAVRVEEEVRLERASGDGSTVRVSVPRPRLWPSLGGRFDFAVERRWPTSSQALVEGGLNRRDAVEPNDSTLSTGAAAVSLRSVAGVTAAAAAAAADGGPEFPLFAAVEDDNAAVLAPGHAAHDASIAALGRIAGAIADPRFADAAARRLFPPPQPGDSGRRLRATRDWVFFHRRRDKDCGEVRAPSAVEARRYRLFHVALKETEDRETLERLLAAGRTLPGFMPRLVTVVEFGPGIQAVQTARDEVLAAWQARVAGGAEIVYGAIASQGRAFDEGAALARARLGSLADLLASASALAGGVRLADLSAIPDALPAAEVDGVVLIATVAVATVCNEVFRIERPADGVAEMVALLQETPLAAALKHLGARPLGEAEFRRGTAEPFGVGLGTVPESWQAAGDGPLAAVLALTQRAAPAADAALAISQSRAVAAGLGTGSAARDPQPVATVEEALRPCPAITLVVTPPVAATVCNHIFLTAVTERAALESLVKAITDQGVTPEQLARFSWLGQVDFRDGTADAVGDSLDLVVRRWQQEIGLDRRLPEGLALAAVAVSPRSARDEARSVHQRQARLVLERLAGAGEPLEAVNGGEHFPVDCPALTLLVPFRAGVNSVPVLVRQPAAGGESARAELALAARFDEENRLVRDDAFERDVARLKESGVKFERVALAGGTRPRQNDPRIAALAAALEEAGLVTAETAKTTRVLHDEERKALDEQGIALPQVFVLEKR